MSTSKSPWAMLLCVLFTILLLSLPVVAQTITGTITGTVTDPQRSVIPGATVTLIDEKTNSTRSDVANEEGRFSFTAVQPGNYTLRIEREGFQALERRGTVLSANEILALGEVKLEPWQV